MHRVPNLIARRRLAARSVSSILLSMIVHLNNKTSIIERDIVDKQLLHHLVRNSSMPEVCKEELHRRVQWKAAILSVEFEVVLVEMYHKRWLLAGELLQVKVLCPDIWLF
jgi:hypothetical protein